MSSDAAARNPHSTALASDVAEILSLQSSDPHAILGAHVVEGGLAVRAYRPEAVKVEVVVEGSSPREMARSHPAGFFEILLDEYSSSVSYQLRVSYPDGNVFTQFDSYAFLPTLGNFDEHLFNEGRHWRLYEKLGAHVQDYGRVKGVSFAVWAPNADGVSVVGSFNNWDGRLHQMRRLGVSGIWEIFIPEIGPGAFYKFEIHRSGSLPFLKTDPYALYTEIPPATSSIVYASEFKFTDHEWMERRAREPHLRRPLLIYEVHLGSWRRVTEEDNRPFSYIETATALADYVEKMGFTHVEFLPLKGHPYGGSWGYQVANYYAPTARFGTPDEFRYLVNHLHHRGIGVIMDWVPAHFPKDVWSLGRFDGTPLYEHEDPRKGEHPDWGTYIFNYGRKEVRNFLIANALFWINECHIDGLRVDAVASMLYLDYSRTEGRWIPNEFGGRENTDAISLMRELNDVVHQQSPGAMMIAEESTSWPLVSRPPYDGGLGFDLKWNMGWMHDTLEYFKKDPIHRRYFHNNLTFGLVYAWSENFILPFSHDEVVHMKGSLINKMAGDRWQKFANLRALYAYMWAHPGKKLLFMGSELGQWREWSDDRSLDWHLLDEADHAGLQGFVQELNRVLQRKPALYDADVEPAGFQWLEADDALENILSFMRIAPATGEQITVICNFTPTPRQHYRIGLPTSGQFELILNSDDPKYGGSGYATSATIESEEKPWNYQRYSATVDLPPLSVLWYEAKKVQ